MSVSVGPRVAHPATPAEFANNVGTNAGMLYYAANEALKETEGVEERAILQDLAIFASDIRALERPDMPATTPTPSRSPSRAWRIASSSSRRRSRGRASWSRRCRNRVAAAVRPGGRAFARRRLYFGQGGETCASSMSRCAK